MYKKFADQLINETIIAAQTEDEIYAGEVFTNKIFEWYRQKNIDNTVYFDGSVWFGTSSDDFMALVTEILNNPSMENTDDAGVSRIISEIYNAMNDLSHLENDHPVFWNDTMAKL